MRGRRLAGLVLVLAVAGCGGGGSSLSPSPPPGAAFRITISGTGLVSPSELVVPPGARVLFVNEHTRSHDMSSDPHPDHSDCPAINQVGLLRPGESRETGNLVVVRACGFHDHDDPSNRNLQGRISIR